MSIAPFEGPDPLANLGEVAPEAYAPLVEIEPQSDVAPHKEFRIIDVKPSVVEASAVRRMEKAVEAVQGAFRRPTEVVALGAVGLSGDAVVLAPAPRTSTLESTVPRVEREVPPKFGIRPSTREDVEAMAAIDIRSFSKVYEGYGKTEAEQLADLTEMFGKRYDMLGGKWMPVVTQRNEAGEDEVVGFMHCCPTSKDPATFVSWEETTNNGNLDTLYDADGKNVYVVTLSMDPKVKGQRGQNLLFMQQIGTFIQEGGDTAFFESRVPGLRKWMESKREGQDVDALSEPEKLALAQEYFASTRERNGKQVPLDPLLKVYDGVGCNLLQLVPNAYKDKPSMDFGVLCTFENPLPSWIRKVPMAGNVIGGAMKLAAKSSWLTRKMFG